MFVPWLRNIAAKIMDVSVFNQEFGGRVTLVSTTLTY